MPPPLREENGGEVKLVARYHFSKVSTAMAIRYLTARMAQQVRKYQVLRCVLTPMTLQIDEELMNASGAFSIDQVNYNNV